MSDLKFKLGQMIKVRRKNKNMSQAQLAEKVEISAKYLGEVERGEGNISIDKLERIAIALGCPLGELLDNSHKAGRPLLVNEINDIIHKATNKEVELIHRVVRSLFHK